MSSTQKMPTEATTPTIKTTKAAAVLSMLTAVIADVDAHGVAGFSAICFRISRSETPLLISNDRWWLNSSK